MYVQNCSNSAPVNSLNSAMDSGCFLFKMKIYKSWVQPQYSVYIVKPTFFNTMVTENFHLHNMRTLVSNCYVTKLWHTHFILPNSLNICLHSLSCHWCTAITDADYHSLIPNLRFFLPVQSSGALITGNTLLLLVLIPLLAQWLEQSRRSKKYLVKQLISIPAVVAFTPALLLSLIILFQDLQWSDLSLFHFPSRN